MPRDADGRRGGWLRRGEPAGTEPWNARSLYRTRLVLAGFGFVVASVGCVLLFARAANGTDAAEWGAGVFFGLIALLAAVNVVVVAIRWRNTLR